jgi:glycosyltransferase involved in cell wall biosynthesis
MRVFVWHVHGSYLTALAQSGHELLVPVVPDRGPEGRGRARTWDWPDTVVEVGKEEAASVDVDVVVMQRPMELDGMAAAWLGGRRPGDALPGIYLEHNAPQGEINGMRHPASDREDLMLVHVTHFNDLFWDAGSTPTRVIEHGIIDPGYLFTGELGAAAMVINEPIRRRRVTGTDLIGRFGERTPVDLFGMKTKELGGVGNLVQADLHRELARRRVYVHPFRWTSLGLALIEAMHLGLPVVAVAVTEAVEAIPSGAGIVSTDIDVLTGAVADLVANPEEAVRLGKAGREHALERFGLAKFLAAWDAVLEEVVSR